MNCLSLFLYIAPFKIGFEEDTYIVREGETVDVCIMLTAPSELQDVIFSDVHFFVEHIHHSLPYAGENSLSKFCMLACHSSKLN